MDTAAEESKITPLNPETLRKEGNKLLNAGKYEEAICKMSEALQIQISKVNNELDYSLAEYYYSYGDAIICKISNSPEIFGEMIREAAKRHSAQQVEENKEEETKGEEGQEQVDDMQIAWENLETGRIICTKELEELNLIVEKRKEVSKLLGRIYLGLGEILRMQSRDEDALIEYEKVLEIRKEVNDPNSRELAEIYFNIGSATLMIKGKEGEAIESLNKAAEILEVCLKKALGETVVEESKEEIKRQLIEVNEEDTSIVKELKEVLKSVYDKV